MLTHVENRHISYRHCPRNQILEPYIHQRRATKFFMVIKLGDRKDLLGLSGPQLGNSASGQKFCSSNVTCDLFAVADLVSLWHYYMTCDHVYVGLFHVIPAWLLFVVLYVSGCETIDWSNMPLLSLFIIALATLGIVVYVSLSVSLLVLIARSPCTARHTPRKSVFLRHTYTLCYTFRELVAPSI